MAPRRKFASLLASLDSIMERPLILHIVTPSKNVSPFDANMAIDAGWQVAMPYTNVEVDEIRALVQDAIFSRGPSGVKRLSLIHISEPTRRTPISYAVFCL